MVVARPVGWSAMILAPGKGRSWQVTPRMSSVVDRARNAMIPSEDP